LPNLRYGRVVWRLWNRDIAANRETSKTGLKIYSKAMKALAFDLGDTLVEYEGLPLSWETHYPDALTCLAKFVGTNPSPAMIDSAISALRPYNTRINPRELEVPFSEILSKLLACFGIAETMDELSCAEAFFSHFRQRIRCFPDTAGLLHLARKRGQTIGVFTDVPYGMPRQLVLEDVRVSGLSDAVDVLMTSRDAGFRKPSPRTLAALSVPLRCGPDEMVYIGNEQKDIEAALAYGCEAVLLDRSGLRPRWGQHKTISSLTELRAFRDLSREHGGAQSRPGFD
jgi:putative hydrolase of the HAD superfamily